MNRGWALKVDSLRDAHVGYLKRPVLILQGAVILLLLVACANVAGLLLAQASARQRELATRVALGSTRSRTVRQLFAENTLLSLAGGALGLVLAYAGLRALLTTALASSPDLQGTRLDWTVLGAAALLSLVTAFIFGAVPALHSSKPDLTASMRSGSRGMTAGVNRVRLRNGFVVAQLALALVLVLGAGLLVRSLMLLNATNPGLDPRNVVAVQVPFPRALYRAGGTTPSGGFMVEFDSRFAQMTEQVRGRMAAIPGVRSASTAMTPPLGASPWRMQFRRPGSGAQQQRDGWSAEWYPVGLSYFETLHIPVMLGRTFDTRDGEQGRRVAVINQTMARLYWPAEDPVGQSLQIDLLDDGPREIVGVVGDVAQDRYQTSGQPQLYLPSVQLPHRMDMTLSLDLLVTSFLVRTDGDPTAVVPALRRAVASADQTLPISTVRTIEEYASSQLRELRQYATLLAVFGILSVALAIVGIAGVMAQAVGQRTNEFGVRLALGAQPRSMLVLVLRHAVVLVSIGLGAGVVASLAILPALRRFLWGISETDLVTLTAAVVGLGVVALIACYVPARRAMHVDPVVALRAD
jgi:putative ABC transport system permease protein